MYEEERWRSKNESQRGGDSERVSKERGADRKSMKQYREKPDSEERATSRHRSLPTGPGAADTGISEIPHRVGTLCMLYGGASSLSQARQNSKEREKERRKETQADSEP